MKKINLLFSLLFVLVGFTMGCEDVETFVLNYKVKLNGFTPAQVKIIKNIHVNSIYHPKDKDLADVETDKDYEADFEGNVQDITIEPVTDANRKKWEVTISLEDKDGNLIASRSNTVNYSSDGSDVEVIFDFNTGISNGLCQPQGEPLKLSLDGKSSPSSTMFWDAESESYLVVFSSNDSQSKNLMSLRIDAAGKKLAEPVVIYTGEEPSLPSLAKTESGYVVAWEDGGKNKLVRVRALDNNGNPRSDIMQFGSAAEETRPVVQTIGSNVALTWMDYASDVATIKLMTVSDQGGLYQVIAPITLGGKNGNTITSLEFPWLAVSGDKLGLSYIEFKVVKGSNGLPKEMGFTSKVAIYDATLNNINNIDLSSSPEAMTQTRLVSTGSGFFGAWEDYRTGSETVRGGFIKTDFTPGVGGLLHEEDSGSANWPALAWNGQSVVSAFYQFRGFGAQIFLSVYTGTGERVGGEEYQQTNHTGLARYPVIQFAGEGEKGATKYGLTWISNPTHSDEQYDLFFVPVVCK